MHDISDNKFLVRLGGRNYITLNSFAFNRYVAEKRVGFERFYKSVYALLAALGFNIHLSGYKYLAALVTMYLAFDDYDEDKAIAEISEYYGPDIGYVLAGIVESIDVNTDFISSASNLLNRQIHARDCQYVCDIVMVVGAIHKLYYNFSVDADEFRHNAATVVPISRLLKHAKQ